MTQLRPLFPFRDLPCRYLPFLLLFALACAVSEQEAVVATYQGGELDAVEAAAWRAFQGSEEGTELSLEELESAVVVEWLAQAAEGRGLDGETSVRVALLDREAALLERALKHHLRSQVEVSEEAIEELYAERLERLTNRPRRVRLRNLFKKLPADPAGRERVRRRMEELRQELLAGADFAELASRESESQTRLRGGMIGLVKPGDLGAEIEEVALALSEGELSPVLETAGGLTLLWCEAVLDGKVPKNLRERVTERLFSTGTGERWLEIEEEARAATEIRLEDARLVSTAAEAPILLLPGGRTVSLAEVESLLRLRGLRKPLSELAEERLRDVLEAFSVRLQAAEGARELGLDQSVEWSGKLLWTRRQLLALEEMKQRVEERFVPLEERDVRAAYEKAREELLVPEQFQLAVVMQKVENGRELVERYTRLESVADDLRGGRLTFADAARRYSDLPSAKQGGLLGWLSRERISGLGPQVGRGFSELSPGEVSGLIQQKESATHSTLWLMHYLDRRPPRPMTFEEARRGVENRLGNMRTRELQTQIEEELVAELQVRSRG